ncbi:MAG: Fe-S cluster assembly protein SufD [Anaerolineales bacterium]|nr:Fe-S cluster assembly protein SufD [Anaerolineales bacterium]MCB8963133.1 Fe-S cluster assembly protein SufD [Ardenticatenales bacterium]
MTKYTKEAVEQLSAHLNEPEWMQAFRLDAWEKFNALPMPVTTDEAWRRTDIRRFKMDEVGPSLNGAHGTAAHSLTETLEGTEASGKLVMVDGVVQEFTVEESVTSQGVVFTDMHTAVSEHGDLVKEYFMTQAVTVDEGKFAAMHGAFWRGGVFLYVPKGVVIETPFRVSNWSSGKTYNHTLVVLAEDAQATLIEEFASATSDDTNIHNGATELLVSDRGNLTYASLQDFGENMWQFNHERGRVGRDAKLDWIISVMGTRLTKAFQTVELDQPGSWARMSGLFFGNGRQHIDLDTQQNHNAPDTVSDLLYKGALKNRARSVWQGMIKTLPGAQRMDGFQANRNLILDKTARADSIPGLEIQADDVRCTHASTIGKLDQEEIFYLMSRGIPRNVATEMVVQGFFDPIMERIPLEIIRDHIAERILDKVRS